MIHNKYIGRDIAEEFNRASAASSYETEYKRSYIVLMLGCHTAGIFAKPILYSTIVIVELAKTAFALITLNFSRAVISSCSASNHVICIFFSPFAQINRIINDIVGLFNPEDYFLNSLQAKCQKFGELIEELANQLEEEIAEKEAQGFSNQIEPLKIQHAKMLGLVNYLIYTNHKDSIDLYCNICENNNRYANTRGNAELFFKSYSDSYEILYNKFLSPEFPREKKMEVIDRFEERNQCVTGFANLLQDICSNLDEPVDKEQWLPWLVGLYKKEIIKAVITEVHGTNGFISRKGRELGLPESVIATAELDFQKGSSCIDDTDLKKFNEHCTKERCAEYLQNYINADLPGRDAYRAFIMNFLAERVTEDQVEKNEVLIKYKHKTAIDKEVNAAKIRHKNKFPNELDPLAIQEWAKFMRDIKLKETLGYIDEGLYVQYIYRLNPEDSEDNKLTMEAIKIFAHDHLKKIKK